MMTENERELSVTQAAKKAGVQASYIRRLCADGRIQAKKIGGRFWIVNGADLARWMAERKQGW